MTAAAARLRRILYAAAFLRALAIGMMAVLIGLYCARLGFSAAQIGVVLSAALWGAALATLLTMLAGQRIPERALLVALRGCRSLGCALLLATDAFAVIVAAAFVGMFNVNGRDRGAIPILEQAMFPATTTDADRTRVFAWYNVLLDAGYARAGSSRRSRRSSRRPPGCDDARGDEAASRSSARSTSPRRSSTRGCRRAWRGRARGPARLSPESRPIVAKISALFFVDAFAGGFIGSAIFAYWFAERFGASRGHGGRSSSRRRWLCRPPPTSRRVAREAHRPHQHDGLHPRPVEPAPLHHRRRADNFAVGRVLLPAARVANEMDVPTRQSYVMAVVKPAERLAAAGITELVRSGGWALAPRCSRARSMQSAGWAAAVFAGVAKIALRPRRSWREFRRVKPPGGAIA